MTWSAKQYLNFENQRTRPVRDLLAGVPLSEAGRVIDIGCGPGNSTQCLAERFPGARVQGLDSSADMIEAARKRMPDIEFDLADLQTWDEPGPFDVILSNAVLQWVPRHEEIMPALISKLAPGGCLAVQMPDNLDTPAHTLMREVAGDGPWASKIAGAAGKRTPRLPAEWYYQMLRPHCSSLDIWITIYQHPLASAQAIVEWFKGSGLRPYLDPLDDAEKAAFLQRYTNEVSRAYPAHADGTVLLPFPRLFIVARADFTPA